MPVKKHFDPIKVPPEMKLKFDQLKDVMNSELVPLGKTKLTCEKLIDLLIDNYINSEEGKALFKRNSKRMNSDKIKLENIRMSHQLYKPLNT